MKKRVLVFPCGSEIGLEIHNALKWSTHFTLFGGSSTEDHGRFVYKNYIGDLPFVEDKDFINKLNLVILKHKIDFIFPAHDSVIMKLAENLEVIEAQVITSPPETCVISRSKTKTYKALKGVVKVPEIYPGTNKINGYPVFMKPDVGQGSKGVRKANSKTQIMTYLEEDPSLIISEFLPGKEATIDCFTNKNGKLLFVGPRIRNRISNGISVDTEPISEPGLEKMAQKINEKIRFRGGWFFQAKQNKMGEYVLLEIAPRIAGTMCLFRNLGVNIPLLSVFDAMGIEVSINKKNYRLRVDRALINRYTHNIKYKNVYMDLDDTLIFGKKINPWLLAFIFQSKNDGKKVNLLTRHGARHGETIKSLEEFKIDKIFDKIIDIDEDKNKSSYISKKRLDPNR